MRFASFLGLTLLACSSGTPGQTFVSDGVDASSAEPAPSGGDGASQGGAIGQGGASSADPGTVVTEPDDEAAFLFDQDELRTYELRIEPEDLELIDSAPADEVTVPARFLFEGEELAVGVRYKGSVGAFTAPCVGLLSGGAKSGKCSIKVSFHWQESGQRFHGLKKLNFHSLNSDPSLLRDRLGYALFRENGVPAPRSVHARLLVNGQLEGLFGVVEQVDGRFARSRFSEGGEGNVYKEIWPSTTDEAAYLAALETNEDEAPSVAKMLSFTADIGTGALGTEAWLDRDMTLRYVAADRVMINDDGAFHWWCPEGGQGNNPGPLGNHNYYWYEALNAARMWLIPWDMDHAFNDNALLRVDPEWRTEGACSCLLRLQSAPACDPMIAQWGTAWNDDFEAAVNDFIAGPFSAANVIRKLDAWEAQIRNAVIESDGINSSLTLEDWEGGLATLRTLIDAARTNRGHAY